MTDTRREQPGIAVERHLECVTRDGMVLRADVYHPADGGRYPTLLNRRIGIEFEPEITSRSVFFRMNAGSRAIRAPAPHGRSKAVIP